MKELEWIKELEEDFKSGDKTRFPDKEIPDFPKRYKKGIDLYRRTAEFKSAYRGVVLYRLAYCYKYTRGAYKDEKKAYQMLKVLAAIDCSRIELPLRAKFTADANISLADCYCRGIGTEKNPEKALAIWEEYANGSDETACRNLGREYLSGKYLKRDYEKAFYWTKVAANFNDVVAINNLGWCYEKGYGTEKDMVKAVKCYKEAAFYGNIVAKNNLKRLKKKVRAGYFAKTVLCDCGFTLPRRPRRTY